MGAICIEIWSAAERPRRPSTRPSFAGRYFEDSSGNVFVKGVGSRGRPSLHLAAAWDYTTSLRKLTTHR